MTRRVAIIRHTNRFPVIERSVMRGIGEQGAMGGWEFDLFDVTRRAIDRLADDPPDGAICVALGIGDSFVFPALARLGIPTVHAGEVGDIPDLHQVMMPNLAIGALGARHLLERGLRHFAFFGFNSYISNHRYQGFLRALEEAGVDRPKVSQCIGSVSKLRKFLTRLPKPAGIMAANDALAWQVARESLRLGINVPQALALVGVGNDDCWCAMASPTLSSIDVPGLQIGRQAMTMLDDLLSGRPTPLTIEVANTRVIERHSSAVVHADNPDIAAAISFVRQRQGARLNASDVMAFAGLSRSTLERGFREVLDRTPLQEILRLRIAAAQQLLADTNLPMKVVATRCGFRDGKHFSTIFRADTGASPSDYRNLLNPRQQ